MLDAESPKPLYEQIKEYILHNINEGTYSPHTRIPSERKLSELFGVSRLTVSKAVKELVQDGWLYVQIGKGTFINDDQIHQELETLTGFTEEMTRRGQKTHSRVLKAEKISPPEHVSSRLKLVMGVDVVQLVRVRFANDQPIAIGTSWISTARCPDILDNHDFERESLYNVFRQDYRFHLTHAEQVFEARAATAYEAQQLHVEINFPVLAITRVTFTESNTPLEFVESVYRGDRYKFSAILRRL